MKSKEQVLEEVFSYPSFRPGQAEIIDHILNQDEHTLIVMPTGGGKSLLYTIPAFTSPNNFTLVISPLISLMKDQVDQLKARNLDVELYNSSLNPNEKADIKSVVFNNNCRMLYISPERFQDQGFISQLPPITYIAIDEAHCISSWGEDFRPSYLSLGTAIKKLKEKSPYLKVIALTATATPEVQVDIKEKLGIPDAKTFIKGFNRENLHLAVNKFKSRTALEDQLFNLILNWQESTTSGIIYAPTRRACEYLQSKISSILSPCFIYHAGLKDAIRENNQNLWMEQGGLMIATTAFGMGVNKSDVRYVINFGHPGSIEDLYQMQGRAGRDGIAAQCNVLTNLRDDFQLQTWFIDSAYPPRNLIDKVLYDFQVRRTGPSIHVDEYTLGKELGIGSLLTGILTTFEKYKLIHRTSGWKTYEILYDGIEDATDKIDWVDLTFKRGKRLQKLSILTDFLSYKSCRMTYICSYFGEHAGDQKCGNCDNCRLERKDV